MRVYLAMIRSYCFLHNLKSFAKTNLVKKTAKKIMLETLKLCMWHGKLHPRYIVSGAIKCM